MKGKEFVSPKCGRKVTGYPALSRADDMTKICTNCGVAEALECMQLAKTGFSAHEIKQILSDELEMCK